MTTNPICIDLHIAVVAHPAPAARVQRFMRSAGATRRDSDSDDNDGDVTHAGHARV